MKKDSRSVHRSGSAAPCFLIFGDADRQEFRLWREALPENVRERVICAESCPSLNADSFTDANEMPTPDFLVLLCSWSGEFQDSWVLELQKKFPLTPILAILGSWCEGEARTGTPIKGVHPVLWYDFAVMAPLECFAFEKGWASIWSLPVTVLPEERVLFELKREEKWKLFRVPALNTVNAETVSDRRPLRFLIESDDFDQFIFLRDLCLRSDWNGRPVEFFSSWLGKKGDASENANADADADANVDFLLFDLPDLSEATAARFRALKAQNPEAVPIAFTEFPRPDEWELLRKENVQIFPKPFRLADFLFFCLERLSCSITADCAK